MNNLKLVAARPDQSRSIIDVCGVKVGADFIVIAGPCSVETETQTIETAIAVKKAGAKMLRGGAFKPRTSPYAFQGLGEDGLRMACDRFESRFRQVEDGARSVGKHLHQMTLPEMDALWDAAKEREAGCG